MVFLLLFWGGIGATVYAYFGYPAVLWVWAKAKGSGSSGPEGDFLPPVTVLLPVHNEAHVLPARLENLALLDYPQDRFRVLVISDGSSDDSVPIAREFAQSHPNFEVLEVQERGGKAGALNTGLQATHDDLVVFTDAGILLEPGSLRALLAPFQDPDVGCTPGEDRVEGGGGEALYGRYELFLRRAESRVASIVGASGSFYAQRRSLCRPFPEGIAPDFLSVLRTVEAGQRAVNVPGARGKMGAARSHGAEFRRKVRTLVRGMAGLAAHRRLLNPLIGGAYAFVLWSHKVMRWIVPIFLLAAALGNLGLLQSFPYRQLAWFHGGFYVMGGLGLLRFPGVARWLPVRVAAYFMAVNAAALVAMVRFVRGHRQEIWNPTSRG